MECPFCEARPRDLRAHVLEFHRDRLQAIGVYRQRVAAGATEADAMRHANRTLRGTGPGTYERHPRA